MVDVMMPRTSTSRGSLNRYAIERLTDPSIIRAWLEPEQAYAAYALGQLEPRLFARAQWWACIGSSGRALVCISRGGLGNSILTVGQAEALNVLLGLHPGPHYAFATFRPEHLAIARRYYLFARQAPMVRMVVTRDTFRPVEGEARRLEGRDVLRVNRLYSTEDGPTFYRAKLLKENVYFGVFSEDRLVAIAGTHVVSPTEGIAIVGNVFTHPKYRNRGLAKVVSSAVTEDLLSMCPEVLLTVESTNEPALHVYQRLGYREVCTLYESPVVRREPRSALALLRRALARWRGRHQDKEIVLR